MPRDHESSGNAFVDTVLDRMDAERAIEDARKAHEETLALSWAYETRQRKLELLSFISILTVGCASYIVPTEASIDGIAGRFIVLGTAILATALNRPHRVRRAFANMYTVLAFCALPIRQLLDLAAAGMIRPEGGPVPTPLQGHEATGGYVAAMTLVFTLILILPFTIIGVLDRNLPVRPKPPLRANLGVLAASLHLLLRGVVHATTAFPSRQSLTLDLIQHISVGLVIFAALGWRVLSHGMEGRRRLETYLRLTNTPR